MDIVDNCEALESQRRRSGRWSGITVASLATEETDGRDVSVTAAILSGIGVRGEHWELADGAGAGFFQGGTNKSRTFREDEFRRGRPVTRGVVSVTGDGVGEIGEPTGLYALISLIQSTVLRKACFPREIIWLELPLAVDGTELERASVWTAIREVGEGDSSILGRGAASLLQ